MNDLCLRHIPLSRSLRILWLLEEIGCAYQLEIIHADGSLRNALCPVIRIPALHAGNVTMHETGAMLEWICETYAPQLGRSPHSAGRPGWLDWLHYGETLAGYVVGVQSQGGSEALQNMDTDEFKRLAHGLGLLESWLEESEWLMSDFSGVDCHVGYSVWIASKVTDIRQYPIVQSYLSRCTSRDAFQRALLMTNA